MCSISIFYINTIRGHSCYPSSLRNHPWGLGIPHQPAIERVQWQLNVTQKIAVAIWMIGSLSVATLLFSRTIRDCVSSASSPFSLKFWPQIPVQFLPLAITSTLSTLSTPSSYLHRDTVIYYTIRPSRLISEINISTQLNSSHSHLVDLVGTSELSLEKRASKSSSEGTSPDMLNLQKYCFDRVQEYLEHLSTCWKRHCIPFVLPSMYTNVSLIVGPDSI